MSPWHSSARHADRRPLLLARNRVKAALRAHLERGGFTETDPGALCVSPGNETHLHAFATQLRDDAGDARHLYLHTSPEFAMKKLLAAGEEKIFAFAPVYRNRESGSALHAPEFTMLEWYRTHAPYEALFDDCAAFLAIAADATGATALRWRDRTCDPLASPEILPVSETFAKYAGLNLLVTIDNGVGDRDALAQQMHICDVRIGDDDTWSDLFSRVLVQCIEPHLGIGRATILCDYPIPEAALARPSPKDARVAERFELYACGVELANGFGELTDAVEQRRRFTADMDEKQRLYGESYPIDEDFLEALTHMPPASGCALGFDRLVMLATGAARIEDVLWAPL
ncbi:MAG: EF-P lysine aminoacylase EpmA [Alphaproteobacteria bacterium]|nr:EF-P lysine aminoacylase EpmA [Alphaproteobacteria bacterium]